MTQKNIVKSAISYYHIIISEFFKQLLEEGKKMDYITWSETREKYKEDLQVKTLVWVFILALVIISFLMKSWLFCSYFALLFIVITYEQTEAQYNLNNLKRPECFSIPERKPEESLYNYFSRIIAKLDGVDPDEVTPEYIQQQYEKRIYPNQRFLPHNPDINLISLTNRELGSA